VPGINARLQMVSFQRVRSDRQPRASKHVGIVGDKLVVSFK